MSAPWYQFDPPTPEEIAERAAALALIAATERAALNACATIRAVAEEWPEVERAATAALAHVAHQAEVEHRRACEQVAARTFQRRRRRQEPTGT